MLRVEGSQAIFLSSHSSLYPKMDALIDYAYRSIQPTLTLDQLRRSIQQGIQIHATDWQVDPQAVKFLVSLSHLEPDSIFYDKEKDSFYRHTLQPNQDPYDVDWEILDHYQWDDVTYYGVDTPDPAAFFAHRYAILDTYRIGVTGLPGKAFDGLPLADCKPTTPTRLIPDLQYKLLSYIPGHALKLPLTDQARVLKEILGVETPIHWTTYRLKTIAEGKWLNMSGDEQLEPWLIRKYGMAEYCLRDLMSSLFDDLNVNYLNYALLTPRFIALVNRFQKHQEVKLLASQVWSLVNITETSDDEVDSMVNFIKRHLTSHLAQI